MKEHPLKIFYIDDDEVSLNMFQMEFGELGYDIGLFSTAEKCFAALDHKPDLIIMDFMLRNSENKGVTGVKALRLLREKAPDVPVIIFSVRDRFEVAVACMQLDAYDFIVKSETGYQRLHRAVNNLLAGRAKG
jgi:two-component system C4-dicarboxylate transport response regulator DctD